MLTAIFENFDQFSGSANWSQIQAFHQRRLDHFSAACPICPKPHRAAAFKDWAKMEFSGDPFFQSHHAAPVESGHKI